MTDKRKKNIIDGIKALLMGALAFGVVVVITVHYGADLKKVDWKLVALMCGGIFLMWLMYEWNKGDSAYDIKDLLTTDGKASLDKHTTAAFALLSMWVVVQQALAGKQVETLLLGVLGIFVVKQGAEKIVTTIKGS